MDLDIDYLDIQRNARRARWRMRLAALALIACVIMMVDLVAQAQPADNPTTPQATDPDERVPLPHSRFTVIG